jgi:hypothetical protein
MPPPKDGLMRIHLAGYTNQTYGVPWRIKAYAATGTAALYLQ